MIELSVLVRSPRAHSHGTSSGGLAPRVVLKRAPHVRGARRGAGAALLKRLWRGHATWYKTERKPEHESKSWSTHG